MKIIKQLFFAAFAIFALNSCVVMSSASVSNPGPTGTMVSATASGTGFLALTTPSVESLERNAVQQLAGQGATKNVTTRLEMRNFVIVQLYKVTATGDK